MLPPLTSQCLLFTQYNLSTLIRNYLNIYEPKYNNTATFISLELLDIMFIPVVAFDKHCNRLGMGKGFYDKTLHYCKYQQNFTCIGLGYDFQKIPTQILPIEKWDVKLTKIITPLNSYKISN